MVTNLIDTLKSAAQIKGKGVIFISDTEEDEFLEYESLYQESLKFLGKLQKSGLKENDELIFQLEDNKTFLIGFWGCILGRIIPVPVKTGTNNEEKFKLFKIWNILKKPHLYTTNKILNKLEIFSNKFNLSKKITEIKKKVILVDSLESVEIGKEIEYEPIKVGFIQFSSGSTGNPKGVVLSHENLITNISGISEGIGITSKDSSIGWMPLTHDMGLIMLHLTNIYSKINQYIIPTNIFVRNPVLWIRKTNEYRTTLLSSPNFGYKHFLNFFKPEMGINWDLSCIRLIYNGAEPISSDLCETFIEQMKKYKMKKNVIFPAYGLAEACVVMTLTKPNQSLITKYLDRKSLGINQKIKFKDKKSIGSISFVEVGEAIKGSAIRITDNNNIPLPEDTVGNIQISGGNVMWGYYGDPKENEKVITDDGWCFTGDLGFIHNKKLTITGRAKDIIFVNGQNIYAHDIERIAEDIEGVELGMVAATGIYSEELEEEEIVLFVRFKKKIEEFVEIRLKLKKHIYIQTGIRLKNVIPVKRIPKTTSGKIQRFKFKENYIAGEYDSLIEKLYEITDKIIIKNENDKPKTQIQKILFHIWEDILESEKISIHDNFFELGGDSLAIIILIGEIHKNFDIDLSISDIFENNSISELETLIKTTQKKDFHSIKRVEDREYYPASPAQKRMYLLSKFKGCETVYNTPFFLRVDGDLNIRKFIKSINNIVRNNEVFRTSFDLINGEVVQKVHKKDKVKINIEYSEEIMISIDLLANDFIKPFDLSKPGLMKIKLMKICSSRYLLIFDIHHIITDGTSINKFIKELNMHYNGIKVKKPRIEYRDFTMWQYDFFKSKKFFKHEKYWLNKFKGELPALNMPLDHTRDVIQSFSGNRLVFRLNKFKVKNLKKTANNAKVTLFMLMFAAYNALLHKYTGQEDIITGTPVSGRNHPDISKMQGVFINTLAIRTFPRSDKIFSEYLNEVKQTLIEGYEHSEYPFEMLIEKANIKRELSRNPLFDTMFIYQNMKTNNFELKDVTFSKYNFNREISAFDFSLEVYEDNEEIQINFDYCTTLFEIKNMRKFIEQYFLFLNEISNDIDKKIGEIKIISKDEKTKILNEFNNTDHNYNKNKLIVELFEEQVSRTPNKIALVYENINLTFNELNEKANQLAWTLREEKIGREDIIPILTERSIEMIIGIYGIIKAGAAYLPIDPNLPVERINYILEDCNAKLFLTKKSIDIKNLNFSNSKFYLEDKKIYSSNNENPPLINKANDLIYVIYTSGSTGNPKGVMIENHSLVNRLNWMQRKYPLDENDTILQKTNYSFDVSVWEIFWWGLYGAKVCLLAPGGEKNPKEIVKTIEKEKITVMHFVPSMLAIFLENNYVLKNKLKLNLLKNVFTSGEALPKKLVEKFFSLNLKNTKLNNLYGPTEACIDVTYFDCFRAFHGNSIPIGKPIDNIQMLIIDKNKNLCPVGIVGELCIAGDGLARGYLNRPELTKEKFINNPFSEKGLLYKTGDLAKWLPTGNIEYLGRIDFQVKIRGYRIELGEIENKLIEIPDIEGSAVKVIENSNTKILSAYYTGKKINSNIIKKNLRNHLPEYMVPTLYIHMNQFPLTSSGKTDRKNLPKINLDEHLNLVIKPKNKIERKILEVWKEVLEINRLGVEDNFFEFGGDSLNAVRVASRLQASFDINISDIFEYPTVRKLSKIISIKKGNLKTNIDKIKTMLFQYEDMMNHIDSNTKLQKEILFYKNKAKNYQNNKINFNKQYSQILLTGATGYLGAYLLKELIENTNSKLILLVRGIDQKDSEKRLIKKLNFYFENDFYNKIKERITIINGDISKENLGIENKFYKKLINNTKCILNSAANVKHYGKYDDFYKTNVLGVINILKFCNTGIQKDLFHISTISVASGKLEEHNFKIFTENDIYFGQEIKNYYIKTKLEAEKEILKWRKRGLNCNILRVGNVMFESKNGQFQENINGNAFYKHIKSLIELGTIPSISFPMDFSFVDNLSTAIVLLTKINLKNETYHLYNPHTICYNQKGKYLQNLQFNIKIKNIEEFCNDLYRAYNNENLRECVEELVMRFQNFDNYYQFIPVCDKTNAILEQHNFHWVVPSEKEIEKMILYGQEKDFFN